MEEKTISWQKIYCPQCKQVVELVQDYLPANAQNDQDALDLLCKECRCVVATLHGSAEKREPSRLLVWDGKGSLNPLDIREREYE